MRGQGSRPWFLLLVRLGAYSCAQVGVGDGGILPGLGQQAVVPVDVVGVEAQLALLDVLLDGVAVLILRTSSLREPGGSDAHPS